jgi:UDP-N-acetylglucosamine 1-carboxyvinyltransferase
VDVVTLPYPGFPTDLLPMVLALNAVADGAAMVTENIFESRFMFIDELARLGADVRTDGHHAVVRGVGQLSGAPVIATDIRAGAGLVLAGLVADGVTTVGHAYHVDRGYPASSRTCGGWGPTSAESPTPTTCRWPDARPEGAPGGLGREGSADGLSAARAAGEPPSRRRGTP